MEVDDEDLRRHYEVLVGGARKLFRELSHNADAQASYPRKIGLEKLSPHAKCSVPRLTTMHAERPKGDRPKPTNGPS